MGAHLSNLAISGVWSVKATSASFAQGAEASSDSGNPMNSGIPRSHRRVLIAVDDSEGSQRAFDFWSGVPGSQDDSVVLVNAVEVPNVLTGLLLAPSGSFDYTEYQKQVKPLLTHAHRLKDQMMAKCEQRRMRCKFITEVGAPAPAILEAAKTFSASVIVVGTSSGQGHLGLLGSVSSYVLQHAFRPVIVVPTTD